MIVTHLHGASFVKMYVQNVLMDLFAIKRLVYVIVMIHNMDLNAFLVNVFKENVQVGTLEQ